MATQNIVILGATGGIGSELTRRLAKAGANVLVASRDQQKVNALASEVNAEGYVLDATQFDHVEACLKHAADTFGHVDAVVNCVGAFMLKPAHLTSEDEWRHMVSANLDSAFAAMRAAGKVMRKSGGTVVLISSAAGRLGLSNHDAVAAVKAGVIGLAMASAATYASKGIRINAVAPGLVQTQLSERVTSNEKSRNVSLSLHATGRLGEPRDIASMIEWLLQPENDWVTGQVFGVDGGLGTVRSYT
jgi:3-oxoacyl-[acyl-carrier protein] reductase